MKAFSTPSDVTSHMEALRALAHALVRDASKADDAVQETLLVALQSPPLEGPTTGAWLAQVLRNVVRKTWRGDARRRVRDAAHTRQALPEAPDVRLARIERAQSILNALKSLSASQREVIELRYFDGLAPRHISSRLERPIETVKSQLKRALAKLRADLDRDEGRDWPLTFVPAFGISEESLREDHHEKHIGLRARASRPSFALITGIALFVLGSMGWWHWKETADPNPNHVAERTTTHGIQNHAARRPRRGPALKISSASGGRARTALIESNPPGALSVPHELSTHPTSTFVAGRVLLVDEKGNKCQNIRGTIQGIVFESEEDREGSIPFANGKFHFRARELKGVQLRYVTVTSMDVDDSDVSTLLQPPRVAKILENENEFIVAGTKDFAIEAKLVPNLRIRVLDARSGTPIPWVSVESIADDDYFVVPRKNATSAPVFSTPVNRRIGMHELASMYTDYRIGAPGYAWNRVGLNASKDIEHVVELEKSGHLTLQVTGPKLVSVPHLVVEKRFDEGSSTYWQPFALRSIDEPGELQLEGLPAGEYRARVLQDWERDDTELGQSSFKLLASVRTTASIRYNEPNVRPNATLAGTVTVSEGWSLQDFGMIVKDDDGLVLLGDSSILHMSKVAEVLRPTSTLLRTFQFDLGDVAMGRYTFAFPSCEYSVEVDTAAHENQIEINIPPPATLTVRVVGDTHGVHSHLEYIRWRVARVAGRWSMAKSARKSIHAQTTFQIRVPQGDIQLSAAGLYFHVDNTTVHVPAKGSTHKLEVHPSAVLAVALHDGQSKIPWPSDRGITLEPLDGDGGPCPWNITQEGSREISVTASGAYRMDIDDMDGYLPIPVRTVELRRGERTRVKVQLVRK